MLRSSLFCLAASLIVSFAVVAQDAAPQKPQPGSIDYLDSLNGFRGVSFGTDVGKFTGFSAPEGDGKVKAYTRKDEDRDMGPAELSEVVYEFLDGKFFSVTLYTKDKADTDELMAIVSKAFGDGEQIDPDNSVWEGKTAFAHFSENALTGEGAFTMGNAELAKKVSDIEQKALDAAVSEFSSPQ